MPNSQPHLLIVEDSRQIANIIKKIAVAANYRVTVASTFAEVKALLEFTHDFDCATIDYALPDALDGEAIPYVLSKHIPGVVMTGKMDLETRKKILAQPVIDYIPKENSEAFLYLKRVLEAQQTNSHVQVLVVDDSLAARNHVEELLRRRNFQTFTANDGIEALGILSANPDIKLIITDHEMPKMDGVVLTTEIRKQYDRNSKVIIGISGAENGIHSARFIKNGADDFLRKPFCPEEFYCRVTQNIEALNHIAAIQKAANTDYLTGLYNRRYFFEHIKQALLTNQQNGHINALALCDIDHFKSINDTLGHDVGDIALKILADKIREVFPSELTSRFGGEEFVICLSADTEAEIEARLSSFRQIVENIRETVLGKPLKFTLSIGVDFVGDKTPADSLSQSDKALYQAKEAGRNQVIVASAF